MAKVVVSDLKAKNRGKKPAAERKRVLTKKGEVIYVTTLNANSKSFGHDLTYAFAKNVAKARNENRKAAGAGNRRRARP